MVYVPTKGILEVRMSTRIRRRLMLCKKCNEFSIHQMEEPSSEWHLHLILAVLTLGAWLIYLAIVKLDVTSLVQTVTFPKSDIQIINNFEDQNEAAEWHCSECSDCRLSPSRLRKPPNND